MAAVPHLLDTNIFLRLAKRDEPQHTLVATAISRLIEQGAEICYMPQNVVEFWNVSPVRRNAMGSG